VLETAIETGRPLAALSDALGFIRDRQRAGIDAAKAKGIYKGRPVTFDRARIVSLRKEGMRATEIARAVECKRGNAYKTLKAAGLNWAGRSVYLKLGWVVSQLVCSAQPRAT
jgi:DNA invertase Pin-like site-specific DNA recombinase